MAKTNLVPDTVFVCGLIHVIPNGRSISNRFFSTPRFEVVTQRVHVRIERIPGYLNRSQVPPIASRRSMIM